MTVVFVPFVTATILPFLGRSKPSTVVAVVPVIFANEPARRFGIDAELNVSLLCVDIADVKSKSLFPKIVWFFI